MAKLNDNSGAKVNPGMNFRKLITGERSRAIYLIILAISVSGLFKCAAFAREAFIAARFGLTSVTDAYFAIQQLPLALATYVYGAFALAFVPAYIRSRDEKGAVSWLPGLVIWGTIGGLLLTAIMSGAQSLLVKSLHIQNSPDVRSTVVLLSFCFVPILLTGLWMSICTSRGKNLWAVSMTGFPYLLMTVALLGLYEVHRLNNLSLPLSMTLGFLIVGIYSLIRIVFSQPLSWPKIAIWRDSNFRAFIRQLGASSAENLGYTGNQFLIIYFLSLSGTGIISANTCAMRIAMLSFTLLGMPLGQLVQAKLAVASLQDRPVVFRRWLLRVVALLIPSAAVLIALRYTLIRLVYMHGKFQAAEMHVVASLLPAWVIYVVVISINSALARYLFILNRGTTYLRQQLIAYAAANLLRIVIVGHGRADWVIWSSVAAEGCSMLLNLRACLSDTRNRNAEPAVQLEVA